MILTTNEHLSYLEKHNRINSRAANLVMQHQAKRAKVTPPDPNNLEPVSYAIAIDVMSAAHMKYIKFYGKLYDENLTTNELWEIAKTQVYPIAKDAFDSKYFPNGGEKPWIRLILMYIETYHEILTGKTRPNSFSVINKDMN